MTLSIKSKPKTNFKPDCYTQINLILHQNQTMLSSTQFSKNEWDLSHTKSYFYVSHTHHQVICLLNY